MYSLHFTDLSWQLNVIIAYIWRYYCMHDIWKGQGSWNEFWAYLFNTSWSQTNNFQDLLSQTMFSINSHVARQHHLGILCKGRSHNCALLITLHQIVVCILLQWSLENFRKHNNDTYGQIPLIVWPFYPEH